MVRSTPSGCHCGERAHGDTTTDDAPAYTGEPALYGPLLSTYRLGDGDAYPHYDALGSVRRLSDSLEVVSSPIDYSAWGELLTAATNLPAFLFVGEFGYYFDREPGTTYVRARSYAAGVGRWLSTDPLDSIDRICDFVYVENRPLQLIDPPGLLAVSVVSANTQVSCGSSYSVNWRFRLSHKAPCSGYFVQKIAYQHCYRSCDQCCDDLLCDLSRPMDTGTFWEAFPFRNPDISPFESELATQKGTIDSFRNLIKNGTCGYSIVEATVKYFCRDADETKGITGTQNLEPIPGAANPTWGRPHPHAGASGLSSQSEPAFWSRSPVEGPTERRFVIAWRCCDPRQDEPTTADIHLD